MDLTKFKAAVDKAHEELNSIIDAEYRGKRLNGLRTLGLAANALTLAVSHVTKAAEQGKPKQEAAPEAAAATPAKK